MAIIVCIAARTISRRSASKRALAPHHTVVAYAAFMESLHPCGLQQRSIRQACKSSWMACLHNLSSKRTFAATMLRWPLPALGIPAEPIGKAPQDMVHQYLLCMVKCTMLYRRWIRLMVRLDDMVNFTIMIQLRLFSSEWEHLMACARKCWRTFIRC